MKFSKKIKAFSLIEVLIFLFIISIIVGIFSFGFNSYRNYREKAALRNVVNKLNFARKTAIAEFTTVRVYISKDETEFFMSYKNKNGRIKKCIATLPHPLIARCKDSIQFTKTGATSIAGTIYLYGMNKNEYYITVEPVTGKVNLYDRKWKRKIKLKLKLKVLQ